jgi:hypothetical protein
MPSLERHRRSLEIHLLTEHGGDILAKKALYKQRDIGRIEGAITALIPVVLAALLYIYQ